VVALLFRLLVAVKPHLQSPQIVVLLLILVVVTMVDAKDEFAPPLLRFAVAELLEPATAVTSSSDMPLGRSKNQASLVFK
jgi:hypothetical protein